MQVIPFSLIINQFLLVIEERKMIVLLISAILLISIFFSFYFFQIYIVFFCLYMLIMILTNILETYVSFLYSQIISSKISGYSGLIIILCTTGGKVLGSLLVSVFLFYKQFNYDLEFKFYSVLFAIVGLVILRNFKQLKVKSISRIMKKQEYFNFQY